MVGQQLENVSQSTIQTLINTSVAKPAAATATTGQATAGAWPSSSNATTARAHSPQQMAKPE